MRTLLLSPRLTVLTLLLVLPGVLVAQGSCRAGADAGWSRVRLVEAIPRDRSRAQVESALLAQARLAIVERAMGISVAGATMRSQSETMRGGASESYTDIFIQQYRQESGGRIVEERVAYDHLHRDSLAIEIEARVACDEGGRAPGFSGSVTLDQPVYRERDTVRVIVESSEDTRVYLFSVGSDGRAHLFFPNEADTSNFLRARRPTQLPPCCRSTPVAGLAPGRGAQQDEYVLALFHRGAGPLPFPPAEASSSYVRSYSFTELNAIILRIPRAERTEAMAPYQIRAREPTTP